MYVLVHVLGLTLNFNGFLTTEVLLSKLPKNKNNKGFLASIYVCQISQLEFSQLKGDVSPSSDVNGNYNCL